MNTLNSDLEKQINAAYDYRGHVTIKFKSGESLEGFVYNRQFSDSKLAEDSFIEIFPKGSDERKKYAASTIQSIELTGENCAQPFTPAK